MDKISANAMTGKVRAYKVHDAKNTIASGELVRKYGEELWVPQTDLKKNTVLYQWTEITSKLLTLGSANYRIAGMYLEFENTALPGDAVAAPTFDRARDITYYNNLSSSSNRDYLRVPLTASQVVTEGTNYTNNKIVFFARSSGTTGVHGKTFSEANNSVIFGASLVAFVDNADATQDLLFSTFYFGPSEGQAKISNSQIGLEWEVTLQ